MEDLLHDSVTRASVYRERYARGQVTRLIRLLEDAEVATVAKIERRLSRLTASEKAAFVAGSATTQRLQALLEQIRELAKTIRQTVNSELNVSLKELVEAELDFSKGLLGAVGIEAELGAGVSLAQTVSAVRSQPMAGRHLRDMVKEFEPNVRRQMLQTLRVGFATGETTPNIVRDLRDSFEVTHRAAERITITSMNHFSNRAYESQYAALGVTHVRLRVTLDGRTGSFCRNINEDIEYPIDKPHPTPPFHPRCRTIVQAVIEPGDVDEGMRPYVADKRKVANIPKGERKGKIGQVRGGTSYHEWLSRQPAGFARSVLGPTKYKLWKSGKLKVDKFIDMRSHRAYTISELRERHGRIFKELNL